MPEGLDPAQNDGGQRNAATGSGEDTSKNPGEQATSTGDDTGPVDWEAKFKEQQKHARTWEQRARQNEAAEKRLKELEDRDKTETQRAIERAEAAEKALATAEHTALRSRIAHAKGVPEALLSGGTEEELTAAAEALLEFKGKTPTGPLVPEENGTNPTVTSEHAAALKALGF